MKILRKKSKQSGQGIIELLIAFFALFTVVFMFVQLALGMGVANYIQYATFLSARTMQSGAVTKDAQIAAAKEVFNQMLIRNGKERFSSIAKAQEGEGDPPGSFFGASKRAISHTPDTRQSTWEQGVTYKFSMKMYMMPLVAGSKKGEANKVKLTSESWLEREPTEEECLGILRERKEKAGLDSGEDFLFDNGC